MEVEHEMRTIGHDQASLPVVQSFGLVFRQLLEQTGNVDDNTVAWKYILIAFFSECKKQNDYKKKTNAEPDDV